MLRPGLSYEACVMGIVRDIIKGRRSYAIGRLKKWSKVYSTGVYASMTPITPQDMFGDVMGEVSRALPSQRQFLHDIEKWKVQGHDTYYNFELAHKYLPVDEAIALQKLRIKRLENAYSLLEELEN
jgi:hypothetical protein